jgi:hypothetical protein
MPHFVTSDEKDRKYIINIIITVVPLYSQVICIIRGYVKPRIIPNAIYNAIFV